MGNGKIYDQTWVDKYDNLASLGRYFISDFSRVVVVKKVYPRG